MTTAQEFLANEQNEKLAPPKPKLDLHAHERLDSVESRLQLLQAELQANTALTQTIVTTTAEIIGVVRGAKGLRSFVVWIAPIVAVTYELYHWIKGH